MLKKLTCRSMYCLNETFPLFVHWACVSQYKQETMGMPLFTGATLKISCLSCKQLYHEMLNLTAQQLLAKTTRIVLAIVIHLPSSMVAEVNTSSRRSGYRSLTNQQRLHLDQKDPISKRLWMSLSGLLLGYMVGWYHYMHRERKKYYHTEYMNVRCSWVIMEIPVQSPPPPPPQTPLCPGAHQSALLIPTQESISVSTSSSAFSLHCCGPSLFIPRHSRG